MSAVALAAMPYRLYVDSKHPKLCSDKLHIAERIIHAFRQKDYSKYRLLCRVKDDKFFYIRNPHLEIKDFDKMILRMWFEQDIKKSPVEVSKIGLVDSENFLLREVELSHTLRVIPGDTLNLTYTLQFHL